MKLNLLQDLAMVMVVAGAMTLLCHRLRQPVVIGYLIAGLMIGPYTPPFTFVHNLESIHTMAELGLVFLMFSLGLEFNLPKITRVGLSAGLAALLEVIAMLTIGYFLGRAFGWSKTDSLFLGSILSISSTTIIVKVFMDFKMMQEKFVQVVFGILVLEDVVAVAILSILSGLGSKTGPDAQVIVGSFTRIGIFIVLFLVLGLFLVPRFIQWVANFKVKEVLGIVTLAFCLMGAILAHAFEFSVALGAFLSGAVLAASKEINEIEEWMHPVRDMFSAIFFVSAGMLIQPALLWEYKIPIAIVTIVTIIGKVFSGAAGSFFAGYDIRTSTRVGMSLAQIGEFSFVIASLGLTLKVTSDFLYPLAVTVSSITTLATPYLIRNSDNIVTLGARFVPASIHSTLTRYSTWMEERSQKRQQSMDSAIFSKYLLRMTIYLVFLIAIFQIGRMSAFQVRPPVPVAIWALVGLVSLPFFSTIAKYSNHIILLLVTKNKYLLHHLNIHSFYKTLNTATVTLIGMAFLFCANRVSGVRTEIVAIGIGLIVINTVFRKRLAWIKEWLETGMDHVIGLATSEPTRQAILTSGQGVVQLIDITDQVTISAGSPMADKTIRDIGLRKKTGATIVAIYREGRHVPNPGPDMTLIPDDILVLLGDEEELEKARALLQ